METIFDHNITKKETSLIAGDPITSIPRLGVIDLPDFITKEWYIANIRTDYNFMDIARLYQERGNQLTANRYWRKIPELAAGYNFPSDYEIIDSTAF